WRDGLITTRAVESVLPTVLRARAGTAAFRGRAPARRPPPARVLARAFADTVAACAEIPPVAARNAPIPVPSGLRAASRFAERRALAARRDGVWRSAGAGAADGGDFGGAEQRRRGVGARSGPRPSFSRRLAARS